MVPGDVDADFLHGVDGERMNVASGFGPGAEDIEVITAELPEPSLGHMTSARIAGAQEQDALLVHGSLALAFMRDNIFA